MIMLFIHMAKFMTIFTIIRTYKFTIDLTMHVLLTQFDIIIITDVHNEYLFSFALL